MNQMSLFSAALGLESPWEVVDAAFDVDRGRIDFHVGFTSGARFPCPHCDGEGQPVYDTRERSWRHLNFLQYHAQLHAQVPRVDCHTCDRTTQVEVPWARRNSGFTFCRLARLVSNCDEQMTLTLLSTQYV